MKKLITLSLVLLSCSWNTSYSLTALQKQCFEKLQCFHKAHSVCLDKANIKADPEEETYNLDPNCEAYLTEKKPFILQQTNTCKDLCMTIKP